MKTYATPLAKRQQISRIHRERYATDEAYRLRCINRGRAWQGLPLRKSLDEVQAKGPRS